jgi:hypothetical protein
MTCRMGKGRRCGRTGPNTPGTIWMAKNRAMGFINGPTGAAMMGSGLIIKLIKKEFISGLM